MKIDALVLRAMGRELVGKRFLKNEDKVVIFRWYNLGNFSIFKVLWCISCGVDSIHRNTFDGVMVVSVFGESAEGRSSNHYNAVGRGIQ